MDIASIIGLIICIGMVILGIALGDDGLAGIISFLDAPSAAITFGGAIAASMISFNIKDFVEGLKSFTICLKLPKVNAAETIKNIIDLSNIARKEGLLALEDATAELEDEFLKKGILLIVDGTDPELVKSIMETELACMETRHKKHMKVWETMSAQGPAWGMIGTLIGLINMLKKLDDPSAIGPNMSVALITTLYGSIIANWICSPIAGKLSADSAEEIMMKEIIIEGLLSIQAGENPRVIEEKLKSFLSPAQRVDFTANDAGGEQIG